MFKRETQSKVVIELDEGVRELLGRVEADLRVLQEMEHGVADSLREIVAALNLRIEEVVSDEGGSLAVGPFHRTTVSDEQLAERGFTTAIPQSLQTQAEPTSVTPDENRIRNTPFNRVPRSVQVEWLLGVLGERGDWVAPILIADFYANDERHRRYLRSIITTRLREMHEEGQVQRRDSNVKGSMFEYRIAPATTNSGASH